MTTTRRMFLAQSAGLALAFRLPAADSSSFEPNAYIRIASDNTITFAITRSEMGQGVRTLLATVLAEELEVDPARVRLEQAVPSARFKGIRLRTSGSGSSSGTFRALRTAGASARQMLIAAAAAQWRIDASACRADWAPCSIPLLAAVSPMENSQSPPRICRCRRIRASNPSPNSG